MGCNCGGTQTTSYVEGDTYGIYGYLPTAMEYTASEIATGVGIILGMAFIAYVAVGGAERKKARAKRGRLYY